MARRRLVVPSSEEVAGLRAEAAGAARLQRHTAPVAQVVGDAAEAHGRAFDEARAQAAELARVDADGLLMRALPLERVDAEHLTRDRLIVDADDIATLRESIRVHGQRTAIEVTSPARPDGQFGLISGWRRLLALRELFATTSDPAFATIKALVRLPTSSQSAYVAMVEENEVRADLSHYERGRIAVVAAERGVFESAAAAVDALFGAASPAKRSKIRSFARIHEALGTTLEHPTAIGERLGLRLAETLRRIPAERLEAELAAAGPFVDAAAELAALTACLDAPDIAEPAAPSEEGETVAAPRRGRPRGASTAAADFVVDLRPGVQLVRRQFADDRLELRLSGPELSIALADAAATALREVLASLDDDERTSSADE